MHDFRPFDEFENKLQADASAPSADPEFVVRLRAQLITIGAEANPKPVRTAAWFARLRSGVSDYINIRSISRGNRNMRTRLMIPTLLAVVLIAAAALFFLNPVTPVSAQQILNRATAAQASLRAAKGVWYTRIETYDNPQLLPGDQAGTTTIQEGYLDLETGNYRSVTKDQTGKIVGISAYDGSFSYYVKDANAVPITVTRIAVGPDRVKTGRGYDPDEAAKGVFDQFNNNPAVTLQGKITWMDGSQAYVLVDQSYQTQKLSDGRETKVLAGMTKMIFDAKTYRLLESQTTVRRDGQDVVVNLVRFLANETLPEGSPVAWDLSDLKGIVFVDEPETSPNDSHTEATAISEHELAQIAKAYVLKPLPAGFTQEIILHPVQPDGQPGGYEVNYTGPSGEYFGLQDVGVLDEGFIESSFYDGSYKTASGLVLHYSPSGSNPNDGHTSAMLTTPEGNCYLVESTLSRAQVQALVDDLTPVK